MAIKWNEKMALDCLQELRNPFAKNVPGQVAQAKPVLADVIAGLRNNGQNVPTPPQEIAS